MILQPQNSFTITRQIENFLDTDTNYVQAVIRNGYTDAIIATVPLVSRGGQRFSANWQVPADPQGQGFYISVVTSVFTDAGYTTKNQNYGDQENTYLVQDRLTNMRQGGAGFDPYLLRKMIKEELANIPPPEPVKMPKMRFGEVLTAIREAVDTIKGDEVETPEPPEKVDLQPVLDAIQRLETSVAEKEVTPETDLSPILTQLSQDNEKGELTTVQLHQALSAIVQELGAKIDALPAKVSDIVESMELSIAPSTATAAPRPQKQQSQDTPFNIHDFAT